MRCDQVLLLKVSNQNLPKMKMISLKFHCCIVEKILNLYFSFELHVHGIESNQGSPSALELVFDGIFSELPRSATHLDCMLAVHRNDLHVSIVLNFTSVLARAFKLSVHQDNGRKK